MGCWNGTCGVSQLPILHHEKIRVFILKPSHGTGSFVTSPNSFVYSSDMFDALGVPFVAEYNDYGTVENIVEDYNTEIIHKALADTVVLPKNKPFSKGDRVKTATDKYLEVVDIQDDMVSVQERNRGKPEIKIIPISDIRHDNGERFYDDIGDLEKTVKLIERNVFEVDNRMWAQFGLNKTAIPGLFYVRENVWQAMIADIEKESEYAFGYKTRKTWLKLIDDFLDAVKDVIDKSESDNDETRSLAWYRLTDFDMIGGNKNPVGRMFSSHSDVFPAVLYKHHILEAVKNNDMDFAKQIMEDVLDTTMFLGAMMHLRKPLIPQCGQGSQCVGEKYHEALNKVVATEIDAIKSYWGDDEDE